MANNTDIRRSITLPNWLDAAIERWAADLNTTRNEFMVRLLAEAVQEMDDALDEIWAERARKAWESHLRTQEELNPRFAELTAPDIVEDDDKTATTPAALKKAVNTYVDQPDIELLPGSVGEEGYTPVTDFLLKEEDLVDG